MAKPFLTLNLPKKGLAAGIPVVASFNPQLLCAFRRIVLKEWELRIENSTDDILCQIDKLEYEKLRAVLDILIPNDTSEDTHEG